MLFPSLKQINTVRYYYTLIKTAKTQNTDNAKMQKRLWDTKDSHTRLVGTQNGTATLEGSLEMFTKKQNTLLSYVSAITFLGIQVENMSTQKPETMLSFAINRYL